MAGEVPSLDRGELESLQLDRLRTTLRTAYDEVPHYRRAFDEVVHWGRWEGCPVPGTTVRYGMLTTLPTSSRADTVRACTDEQV